MSIIDYRKNTPEVTFLPVTYRVTMQFSHYLASKMAEKGLRAADLARRAGTTRQNISRILNDTPHPITGKPMRPSSEMVNALAKALGVDIDEARQIAGYAPTNPIQPPTNLKELIEALDRLGIPVPEGEIIEEAGAFQEALQRIRLDLELVMNRDKLWEHIEGEVIDSSELIPIQEKVKKTA